MAYSTLATQADTPTAGPNGAYFQQVAANFTELRQSTAGGISQRATAQTITPNSTVVPISMSTEVFDKGNCINIAGNPTRITVPASMGGRWFVGGALNFADTSGSSIANLAAIRVSGTTDVCQTLIVIGPLTCTMGTMTPLVAGDYIEMYVFTAGGAGQPVAITPFKPFMWAFRISA